ncbi:hypothetical protein D3C84_983530 [compost metagenome]
MLYKNVRNPHNTNRHAVNSPQRVEFHHCAAETAKLRAFFNDQNMFPFRSKRQKQLFIKRLNESSINDLNIKAISLQKLCSFFCNLNHWAHRQNDS